MLPGPLYLYEPVRMDHHDVGIHYGISILEIGEIEQ